MVPIDPIGLQRVYAQGQIYLCLNKRNFLCSEPVQSSTTWKYDQYLYAVLLMPILRDSQIKSILYSSTTWTELFKGMLLFLLTK
jgi:hypothetical protein